MANRNTRKSNKKRKEEKAAKAKAARSRTRFSKKARIVAIIICLAFVITTFTMAVAYLT